mmetsp:Transcript_52764/g.163986  ORF Transcript_52764/g.163986 Transcript_52764/m.163986 type:complete len:655 (+) Transcript_52764:1248-3212(+)
MPEAGRQLLRGGLVHRAVRELELPQTDELRQRLCSERLGALLAELVAGEHELLQAGLVAKGRGEVLGHLGALEAAAAEVELPERRQARQRRGRQGLQALLLEVVESDDELLQARQMRNSRCQRLHGGCIEVAMGKDDLLELRQLREGVLSEHLCTILSKLIPAETQPLQFNEPPEARRNHLHCGGADAAIGEVEVPQLDQAREAIRGEDLHKIPTKVVALEVESLQLREKTETWNGLCEEARPQTRTFQIQGLKLLRLGGPLLLAKEGERPHKLAHGLPVPEVKDLKPVQLGEAGCERLHGGPRQVAPPHVKDFQVQEMHDRLGTKYCGPLRAEVVSLVAEHVQALDVLERRGQLLRSRNVECTVGEVQLLECAQVGEGRCGERRGAVSAELVALEGQPLQPAKMQQTQGELHHCSGVQPAMREVELSELGELWQHSLGERLRALKPDVTAAESQPLQPPQRPQPRRQDGQGPRSQTAAADVQLLEAGQLREARRQLRGLGWVEAHKSLEVETPERLQRGQGVLHQAAHAFLAKDIATQFESLQAREAPQAPRQAPGCCRAEAAPRQGQLAELREARQRLVDEGGDAVGAKAAAAQDEPLQLHCVVQAGCQCPHASHVQGATREVQLLQPGHLLQELRQRLRFRDLAEAGVALQ